MIKITVNVTLPYDNEIQFFDACQVIGDKLKELGQQALDEGDCEQFVNQTFTLTALNDDDEKIGNIRIKDLETVK